MGLEIMNSTLQNYYYNFYFFASAAPQRPTCNYHANPAGSPTRNDVSLQVGEMPDSNPGLQVLQSGALPFSHHIPYNFTIDQGKRILYLKLCGFFYRKSKRKKSRRSDLLQRALIERQNASG